MNREIKFRGLQLDRYKLVFGYFHLAYKDEHRIYELGYVNTTPYEKVIPETVGQYTGLKDKNGTEIYEGDIIDHYALFGYVVYENGIFSLSSNTNTQFCNCKQPLAYHDVNEMEVIGNIHQNPELITK